MKVWKIIFLSKWVLSSFHGNLSGCIWVSNQTKHSSQLNHNFDPRSGKLLEWDGQLEMEVVVLRILTYIGCHGLSNVRIVSYISRYQIASIYVHILMQCNVKECMYLFIQLHTVIAHLPSARNTNFQLPVLFFVGVSPHSIETSSSDCICVRKQ